MKKLKPLIVILGPTASGKTDLAIKLAKKFKGEIISADSRQIYKGMDIGTGKTTNIKSPTKQHLQNLIKPNQQYNVAVYKKGVIKIIKSIQKREKIPFLVGGTGLYISAVVDNIDFPQVAPQTRLREKLEKKTLKELFKTYKSLDPRGAKFIDKDNKRRLVRAIEVCIVTKKPFWTQRQKKEPLFDILQIGIELSKKELKKRIEKRVKKMIKRGLEKEVKYLVKKCGWTPPLLTIGYQEWKDYFEGKIDKDEVEKLIIQHTIQFAKRQMTWFKKDKRVHWLKNYRKAEKLVKIFVK